MGAALAGGLIGAGVNSYEAGQKQEQAREQARVQAIKSMVSVLLKPGQQLGGDVGPTQLPFSAAKQGFAQGAQAGAMFGRGGSDPSAAGSQNMSQGGYTGQNLNNQQNMYA